MEEEAQPKGATIVKDLLEVTVRLAIIDAYAGLAVQLLYAWHTEMYAPVIPGCEAL